MEAIDLEQLSKLLDKLPGMPLMTFKITEGWYMDESYVYWVCDGESYSEEIYEAPISAGEYMMVNLRLSTGCTETNFFKLSERDKQ